MRCKQLYMLRCIPVFAFYCLVFAGTARGEDAGVSTDTNTEIWSTHLRQCTEKTFSLTGRFAQDFTCDDAPASPVLHGSFEFRRNGSYRVTYDEPGKIIFVSDGTVSSVLDRGGRWTASGPVDALADEIASLVTGRLPEGFHVDFLGGAHSPDEGLGVLRFSPKEHRFIQSILVTASPESPCIRRITIIDTGGCIIRTTLESVRVNTGVKARRFQIHPPKNTFIIEP